MLRFMKVGILVCVVVVLVVVMVFFGERSLLVMEVECLWVGVWFVGSGTELGGGFVVVVLEVVVEFNMRQVCACLNERTYFLWCMSLILVEATVSNVGRRPFRMVKR